MKLAQKFFNESYENEKRFRLQAEIEKAKQLEENCLKLFKNFIQPAIEDAVKNGLYSVSMGEGQFLDLIDQFKLEEKFVNVGISEINSFLRKEGFIVIEDHINDFIKISWKLDRSPMSEDPAYK